MFPECANRLSEKERNQALWISRNFELPGNEAVVRKEENRLVIEPVTRAPLLGVLVSLESLDADSPEIEELSPENLVL